MPVGSMTDMPAPPDHLVLRWSQPSGISVREENVEFIRSSLGEATIRCLSQLEVDLRVNLISKSCEREGVVRSCIKEGSTFVVAILIDSDEDIYRAALLHNYDPGSLIIDDFLSEEDEAKILGDLEEELKLSEPQQFTGTTYGAIQGIGHPTHPSCTLQYTWSDPDQNSRFCLFPNTACPMSRIPSQTRAGFSHVFNALVSCTYFSGLDYSYNDCAPLRGRHLRPESTAVCAC